MGQREKTEVTIASNSRFMRSLIKHVLGESKKISVISVFKKLPSLSNITNSGDGGNADWLFVSTTGNIPAETVKNSVINDARSGKINLLLHNPHSDRVRVIKNKRDTHIRISSFGELKGILASE